MRASLLVITPLSSITERQPERAAWRLLDANARRKMSAIRSQHRDPFGLRLVVSSVVLLAEDDAEMRSLVGRALREDGYEIVEATNGLELFDTLSAVAQAGIEGYATSLDLVITDVRMPGLSGLDAIDCLRHAGWHAPLVVMTAFVDASVRETATRLGAAALLEKPFSIAALRSLAADLAPVPRAR